MFVSGVTEVPQHTSQFRTFTQSDRENVMSSCQVIVKGHVYWRYDTSDQDRSYNPRSQIETGIRLGQARSDWDQARSAHDFSQCGKIPELSKSSVTPRNINRVHMYSYMYVVGFLGNEEFQ